MLTDELYKSIFNDFVIYFWEAANILIAFALLVKIPLKKLFKGAASYFFILLYPLLALYFCTFHTTIAFLLLALFCIIYFIIVYNIPVYAVSMAVSCIVSVIIGMEIIVSFIASIVFMTDNLPAVLANQDILMIYNIISRTVQTIAVVILGKKLKSIPSFTFLFSSDRKYSLFSYIILQTGVFSLIISSFLILQKKKTYTKHDDFLFPLICTIFFVLLVIDYMEREKYIEDRSKLNVQRQHSRNMEQAVDILRRERHEFVNHLNVICAMLSSDAENKEIKIKEYMNKILGNMSKSCVFYNSGNVFVDGLLTIKNSVAHDKNIRFDVSFDAGFDTIKVDDTDIISIVGNLIDNAIEAVEQKLSAGEGIVSIYTFSIDQFFFISVTDNAGPIDEDVKKKMFEDKFTTKKNNNSVQRGSGLYIVKFLVSRYGGEIVVQCEDVYTEFIVKIPMHEAS